MKMKMGMTMEQSKMLTLQCDLTLTNIGNIILDIIIKDYTLWLVPGSTDQRSQIWNNSMDCKQEVQIVGHRSAILYG